MRLIAFEIPINNWSTCAPNSFEIARSGAPMRLIVLRYPLISGVSVRPTVFEITINKRSTCALNSFEIARSALSTCAPNSFEIARSGVPVRLIVLR